MDIIPPAEEIKARAIQVATESSMMEFIVGLLRNAAEEGEVSVHIDPVETTPMILVVLSKQGYGVIDHIDSIEITFV